MIRPVKDVKDVDIKQAIRTCGFLAAVDDDTVRLIAGTATVERHKAGDLIFPEGAECRGMFVVAKGAVKIYKIGPDGREHIVHIAEPGDVFGEAALFLGLGYPANATAIKDSSLVLLRKGLFIDLIKSEPDLSFKLLGSMAIWAHRLVTKVELLTLRDASSRLAGYFLSKSEQETIELNIPKHALAAQLDMASETLSRMLNKFEAQGIIAVHGRSITILSRKLLEETAEMSV